MGLFPTNAVNGQQVTNAKGTVFEYDDVEDKWFIIFETDVYTQAQVDALLHDAVTVNAPIVLTGQDIELKNDAAAQITEIDTDVNLAGGDIKIPTDLAAKTYIDTQVATKDTKEVSHAYVEATALTLENDLNMGTHKITGVVDPVADQEAATKKYHDDNAGGTNATLNAEDVTIAWNADGAANTNYQSIDLDSYFTVPANVTAVSINIRLRDGTAGNYIDFGATETDGLNIHHTIQVTNIDTTISTRCPLATGNIIKMKCNINPGAFTRIWIRLVEYYYD